ncbi:MAG: DUF4249 domain-containing protein [Bacteroidota bacterium]
MKKLLNVLAISITLFACEKTIDLNLDESSPQLVIEANLAEGETTLLVIVSRSTPYFEPGTEERIDQAIITLYDDHGNITAVPNMDNGQYAVEMVGVPGTTYRLEVILGDATYTAVSTMLQNVELLELEADFEPESPFNDEEGYEVLMKYNDPAGQRNYYRPVYSIDGVPQREGEKMQVITDDFNDGVEAKFPITGDIFQSGEVVLVELRHLDESAYDYFKALVDIVAAEGLGSGIAAPGNPVSNWTGGAGVLGHFTAYSLDTLSITIP